MIMKDSMEKTQVSYFSETISIEFKDALYVLSEVFSLQC